MTQKLDPYRPTYEIFQDIRRQIIQSGIDPDHIDNAWVEASIAATIKWIVTTQSGAEIVTKLLGFQSKRGDGDKEYIYYPDDGPVELPIKPENISFFRGVMINGSPADLSSLDVKDKDDHSCEGCGIISHCPQNVLDPYDDSLVRLCNFCILSHENPKVYDQGDSGMCGECPKAVCSHHPTGKRGYA